MSSSSFLQIPVRLRESAPEFFERLAAAGPLCIRAKNLTAEMVALADGGDTVIRTEDEAFFPSLGLRLFLPKIAGVHALKVAQLPDHSGVIEMDFEKGFHPLSVALPGDSFGAGHLRELVAAYCLEETELEDLQQWRGTLAEPFQACPCCQAAADRRRAHPEAHPLAPILQDVIDSGLPLHCQIYDRGFQFDRFLEARKLVFRDAITVRDTHGECLLQIDPAYAHALWVLPVAVDGEIRSTVRVYDTLGGMNLVLSVACDLFVERWQHYCAAACR